MRELQLITVCMEFAIDCNIALWATRMKLSSDISKLGKKQQSATAWDSVHDFYIESSHSRSLFSAYGQTLVVAHDLAKLSRLAV